MSISADMKATKIPPDRFFVAHGGDFYYCNAVNGIFYFNTNHNAWRRSIYGSAKILLHLEMKEYPIQEFVLLCPYHLPN